MSITAADRITATPCPDALAAISGDLGRSSLMAIDREIASLARFVAEPADEVLVEALLERLAIVTALVDGLAHLPPGASAASVRSRPHGAPKRCWRRHLPTPTCCR